MLQGGQAGGNSTRESIFYDGKTQKLDEDFIRHWNLFCLMSHNRPDLLSLECGQQDVVFRLLQLCTAGRFQF